MGLDAGGQHIKCLHGLVVAVEVVLHHLHRLQLLQASLLGYLILTLIGIVLEVAHIGDVAHVAYLVASMLQVAEEDVEGDGGAGVTQMGIAIYGGTAHIHAHMILVQGLEELLAACERIINE